MESYKPIREIGKGAYGTVYICKNNSNETYAMKVIPTIAKYGAPSLLEASITMSLRHPHIVQAKFARIKDNSLRIVQELLPVDLLCYIRETRDRKFDIDQTKKWTHQLLSGIDFLHKCNIIHGDIKPSNVIIDDDFNLKIIDFTFSRLKTSNAENYSGIIGSRCYFSPETLAMGSWSNKIDIWALGCTIYECYTKERLIPCQVQNYSEDAKLEDKKLTLSCIREWRTAIGDKSTERSLISKRPNVTVDINMWDAIDPTLRDLIYSMTIYKQSIRPSAANLLDHPLLAGMPKIKGTMLACKIPDVRQKYREHVDTFFDSYPNYRELKYVTSCLYYRIHELEDYEDMLKLCTCFWIAHKVVKGTPPRIVMSYTVEEIIAVESAICDELNYMLHVHV